MRLFRIEMCLKLLLSVNVINVIEMDKIWSILLNLKNGSYIFVNFARPTDVIDDFRMDLGIQF